MVPLVCDICGGKLAMGAGSIAVCESCGMEHTKERMQEKVQEIKGTVVVDNSHLIDNYFNIAENAYESDNKLETETYCNKIIEINPNNHLAWLLKGKAAGWQSDILNIRLNEAAVCFTKAIELAPNEEKESIKIQSASEIGSLANALINLRGSRFIQFPDESEVVGFERDISLILNAVMTLSNKTGAVVTGVLEEMATIIDHSVVTAFSDKIYPDYIGKESKPNEYEWSEFIDRIGFCTLLEEKALELSDIDYKEDIQRYENLIFLHQEAIKSCSYYCEFTNNGKFYQEDYMLSNEAKKLRNELIDGYNDKIKEIKIKSKIAEKEETYQRIEKYWDENREQKMELDNEKSRFESEISKLNDDILKLSKNSENTNIQEMITALLIEKKSLGLFNQKQKKIIQDKIDSLLIQSKDLEDKNSQVKLEIENNIRSLQNKIYKIDQELTKNRE